MPMLLAMQCGAVALLHAMLEFACNLTAMPASDDGPQHVATEAMLAYRLHSDL